ncbi:5-(carboxyamino)imidazole ribonucleotide synthase [Marinivivus vitaminiproducens]|uniref:5-(carboxyamino)imidazole ribonucleotide synthase n=1 Tax=Marinivivus vitaminiproducens TaxID=3035935 RepID=UPI0027A67754|nr:5-(carboxyamino)imidazole ribonucleotide synthase [Geminicoccaceae bacterium SCSIO 64248]
MSRVEPILPGAVIGIVGGGQLGRMTALAAARLGYRCHILTPGADDPAVQVAAAATIAPYDDPAALDAFAAAVDVVTFEFENLPSEALSRLAERRPVRPGPDVLAICQDRIREKAFLGGQGIPIPAYRPVESARAAQAAFAELGAPAVLKTARLGYDGKGQAKLGEGDDAAAAFARLGDVPCVLEAFVAFELEASVIAARDVEGRIACYPLVANRHVDHILSETTVPAAVPDAVAADAVALAGRIAQGLDLVGLVAVEMFITDRGGILVNELAPRPHNSGHWSIEASVTSQFEQLVRAVCGLPLGDPSPLGPARMLNLIGDDVRDVARYLAEPGAHVHLYGKAEARPGRKMGHVTWLDPTGA